MKNIHLLTIGLLLGCLSSCSESDENLFIKSVRFSEETSLEKKIEMAARVVPTRQQLDWQRMEMTAFVHFGLNTFTDKEWGNGKENPQLFNPTALDAEQWVRELKNAGFKLIIATAKHHDGFCLWQTATTKYSVASSPWKDGKGDVVREISNACKKFGVKFGIYLSPWDRNAECYGDSPRYNEFFIKQLTELLTDYGEVCEVWFDGACGEGPNGKKQKYDWALIHSTVDKLQPNALTAIVGDDIRWVGNERGYGRETEWSVTPYTPNFYANAHDNNVAAGVNQKAKDLGSRAVLANAKELFWYPSEVDVSIRPGWFWHERQNEKVKSLSHLMNIYFKSVGYNSVLLLNIPPDNRGLLHENDVARLREFSVYRNQMYSTNMVVKGDKSWQACTGESKTFAIKPKSKFNVLMLQENIAKGQRVENVSFEIWNEGKWQNIAEATTVGQKRLIRIPETTADSLRVTLNSTRLTAEISHVAAFYAKPIAENDEHVNWNNISRKRWNLVSKYPFVLDLGDSETLQSFTYAPKKSRTKHNLAFKYSFYVSQDGTNWEEVKLNGEFGNIVANPLPQTVVLPKEIRARYIKLDALSIENSKPLIDLDELGVVVRK